MASESAIALGHRGRGPLTLPSHDEPPRRSSGDIQSGAGRYRGTTRVPDTAHDCSPSLYRRLAVASRYSLTKSDPLLALGHAIPWRKPGDKLWLAFQARYRLI